MAMDGPGGVDGLGEVIDLDRYPLHERDGRAHDRLIEQCRDELAGDGCCVLKGFVTPASVARVVAEAERLAPQAHRSEARHNPYFSDDDPALPETHPRRVFQTRTNGFVCGDLIEPDSDLRLFFDHPATTAFVTEAFGKEVLFQYADPLAAMPINAMRPGDQFPWHFDTNEFAVTIVIQPAEEGGVFQYAPNLRSTEDERPEAVAAVLAGERDGVTDLKLEPGDIQLFMGRFTLHRVTRVEGRRNRYVAIPSWANQPGMVGQQRRTLDIYGRLTELHRQQETARADGLMD